MITERIILQVLTEQKDEKNSYDTTTWVTRREESLFELNSSLAQIVIGVRRSGKSTLCHKVLIENGINYAYANFDDDRLASLSVEDLNTLLSCIYQIYGADIQYLFLDEVQNVESWPLILRVAIMRYISFLSLSLSTVIFIILTLRVLQPKRSPSDSKPLHNT